MATPKTAAVFKSVTLGELIDRVDPYVEPDVHYDFDAKDWGVTKNPPTPGSLKTGHRTYQYLDLVNKIDPFEPEQHDYEFTDGNRLKAHAEAKAVPAPANPPRYRTVTFATVVETLDPGPHDKQVVYLMGLRALFFERPRQVRPRRVIGLLTADITWILADTTMYTADQITNYAEFQA